MLIELISKVSPRDSDQLIFLGDYIDRRPDSRGVIEYLLQLNRQYPQTVFLSGNHDQMLLDALAIKHPERLPEVWIRFDEISSVYESSTVTKVWLSNGGLECLGSYGQTHINSECFVPCWELIPQEHIEFLAKTKLWRRQDCFLFVHAGHFEEKTDLGEQMFHWLWARFCDAGRKEIHVVGHTVCPNGLPHFEQGRYRLDTGAGRNQKLTACNVLNREYWQA
jgi:serine/threonine protein phosphatase 1